MITSINSMLYGNMNQMMHLIPSHFVKLSAMAVHRYCASITSQKYQSIKEDAHSFLCPCCDQGEQQEQINSLKNMVEALKLEISSLKESLSSHTAPTVPAPTVPTSLMPASPTANGLNGPAISTPRKVTLVH